jgi:hypothetical protein
LYSYNTAAATVAAFQAEPKIIISQNNLLFSRSSSVAALNIHTAKAQLSINQKVVISFDG